MRKASKILSVIIVVAFVASFCATAYAQSVYVYICPIGGSSGTWVGDEWVGQIPIKIGGFDCATNGQSTYAYCMNPDKTLNIAGTPYPTALAGHLDDAKWKSIAYILTWYDPPSNNDQGTRNQLAIWNILGYASGSLPTWNTAASNLVTEATGKDVVRNGDKLNWVSPIIVNGSAVKADPGQVVDLTVKLTDASNNPRPGVKMLFSVTGVSPSRLSATIDFTDNAGIASVTLTIPPDMSMGSTIGIEASTRSVWPRVYLDLNYQCAQDLIGIDTTYDLTVDARYCVIGTILFQVPEVPLGTLAAVAACIGAFVVWKKKGQKQK